jgi:hypothetical protein
MARRLKAAARRAMGARGEVVFVERQHLGGSRNKGPSSHSGFSLRRRQRRMMPPAVERRRPPMRLLLCVSNRPQPLDFRSHTSLCAESHLWPGMGAYCGW